MTLANNILKVLLKCIHVSCFVQNGNIPNLAFPIQCYSKRFTEIPSKGR